MSGDVTSIEVDLEEHQDFYNGYVAMTAQLYQMLGDKSKISEVVEQALKDAMVILDTTEPGPREGTDGKVIPFSRIVDMQE